jgi:hypothetical protein
VIRLLCILNGIFEEDSTWPQRTTKHHKHKGRSNQWENLKSVSRGEDDYEGVG